MPAQSLRPFHALATRARRALARAGHPFPLAEAYFIPHAAFAGLQRDLEAIATAYAEAAAAFARQYEALQAEMLAAYPDLAQALAGAYPPAEKIPERFRLEWQDFLVVAPEDAASVERFQAQMADRATRFLDELAESLRDETITLCTKIAGRISRGDLLTERTLEGLRQFIRRFRTLNLAEDGTVEAALARLEAEFLQGPAARRLRDHPKDLAALQAALCQAAEAASAITDVDEATGEPLLQLQV